MKNENLDGFCHKMPYSDETKGTYYGHFFNSAFNVNMCTSESWPIYKVELCVWVDPPEEAYWSWWSHEKEEFHWLYTKRMILEMCFAYGFEPEIKAGRGEPVQVHVMEVAKFTIAECKASEWKP